MRDLLGWNLSLGRWGGVQVRLHVFFVLFAVVTVHLAAAEDALAYAGTALAVLFFSVLFHEFGHCCAAWHVGGSAEQILVWPLGGLADVRVPHDHRAELLTAMAGPVVNLMVWFLAALALLGGRQELSQVLATMHPLRPPASMGGTSWNATIELIAWVNWILFLVNLVLPAVPLDGGRMWRSILWPQVGYRSAVLYVARAAQFTAGVLFATAWFVRGSELEFASLPLTLFGILLFFSARQEADRLDEQDAGEALLGYEFASGYGAEGPVSRAKRSPGRVRQWLDKRRADRLMRKMQLEQEEERKVDELLALMHERGPGALSPADRALLDRVSRRYRTRLHSAIPARSASEGSTGKG